MAMDLKPAMHPVCFEDFIEGGRDVMRRNVPMGKDPNNPVLVPERPWEGQGVVYPSVWRCPETGLWRMWYSASVRGGPSEGIVAYAESEDGVHWQRPELGKVEYSGSTANNLVSRGDGWVPCVYMDMQAPPEQRYRMTLSTEGRYQNQGGINFYVSPDGIDWRPMPGNPILRIRNDSQCPLVRHPENGKWAAFHRPGFGLRVVTCSRSEDGVSFTGSGAVIQPDDYDRALGLQNYALSVFPYDGGFIGIMKMMAVRWHDMRCWLELVVCRDVTRWQDGWKRLYDRTPIVPLGADGEWDSLCMSGGHGLVPVDGGHWFYYDCWNARHAGDMNAPHARACIGRAFIPTRRLAECVAMSDESHVNTVPVLPAGEMLILDYDARDGEIRASVTVVDGETPEGFSAEDSSALVGDSHEGRIDFKGGSLRRFEKTPVRITVHMSRGARLYALGVL